MEELVAFVPIGLHFRAENLLLGLEPLLIRQPTKSARAVDICPTELVKVVVLANSVLISTCLYNGQKVNCPSLDPVVGMPSRAGEF